MILITTDNPRETWTIPLGKKEAVVQLIYFCRKKIAYCRSQSGVTFGTQSASKIVVEQDIRRVADEFELPIVNEIWERYVQLKIDVLRKFALRCSFSESMIENLEKHL